MRMLLALVLATVGVTMGCDARDPCFPVGGNGAFEIDFPQTIEQFENHAIGLGLPTTTAQAASILGAAYAISQIEGGQPGVPVRICLRQGTQGDTEFRVFSLQGKLLSDWRSAEFARRNR